MDKLFILNFLAIFLCWQNGFGWTLQLGIDQISTDDVHLKCKLDSSDCQVKEIMVLEMLNPQKKPIAIVRLNSEVSINVGFERDFRANGHVSHNISESYLDVTLSKPTAKDAGIYSCVVYYLNETGFLTDMRKNATLEVDNNETPVMVKRMMERISRLEINLQEQKEEARLKETTMKKQIALLETKLENKDTECIKDVQLLKTQIEQLEYKLENVTLEFVGNEMMLKDKINGIENYVNDLETQLNVQNRSFTDRGDYLTGQLASLNTVFNKRFINQTSMLEEQLKSQEISLNQLVKKESYKREAFSFAYSKAVVLSPRDVMIFDDVIMNESQGYNAPTGTYTAPISGLYFFQLAVCLRSATWMNIDLSINGAAYQKLLIGDSSYDSQSSMTSIVKMAAGDKVSLIVHSRHSSFAKNSVVFNGLSVFSGYLIKAL